VRADSIDALAPLAARWFTERFGACTQAQSLAWPAIASGEHALLVAPTGSGKTLAAFLQPLGRLAHEALAQPAPAREGAPREPDPGVRVLYISPLRALDADVHHNLHAPLDGIAALARAQGTPIAITHAVRTGDTSQRDRREAAKRPPHVLITTPESLFVLLGSEQHRRSLARVELVIVDELHAIADSKRGTHLALSLERLEQLAGRTIQRVGLTATAEPLDRLAMLLGGDRPVRVLDGRKSRSIELSVEVAPRKGSGKQGDPRVDRVATLVGRATRSLVFVGSRALAERWRPTLEASLQSQTPEGEAPPAIGIHHGALAKEVREVVEAGLRDGSLRAVVATSSLELGIDIGAVDMVVQVGAPGGVARLLQRVGRAGHSPGQTSRGVLVSSGGVDLLECAITARLALEGRLEPVRVPVGPIDVLAQQLIAHAASEADGTTIDSFLAMAQRSDPYRALSRESLVRVVDALSSELHRMPRLTWDRHTGALTAPDLAKRLARTAGGTITSRGLYRMLDADSRETIGELDEEFIHESKPGDRFSFGLGVYRIVSVRPDAVLVRRAPPGSARMPFWRGDRPMRAEATGRAMGAVIRSLEGAASEGPERAAEAMARELPLSRTAAVSAAEELCQQAKATPLPTDRRVVVEVYSDALGEPRIAVHAWHGRSVLEPWALALAARVEARLGGVVHAVATDNGVLIAPPKGPHVDAAGVPLMVSASEVRALVAAILPRTAIAGAAFREAAERSLLLPREPFKKRTPLWMNRQRARDLLLTVGDDPTHPLLVEASREVMDDRWNVAALERLLRELESGEVTVEAVTRKTPSPFARGLETAFEADNLYEDDTPAGESAARRASSSGAHDGGGSFESPLDLVGLAEPADRGVLTGLSHEAPLALQLFRAGGPVPLEDLARHLRLDEPAMRAALAPLIAAGQAVVGRFSERDAGDLSLEVCDAEGLARMRRRALSRARRQIEPVPRRAFQRWLLERQRVGPYALEGEEAIAAAVERLALYPAPPELLERDLFRARVQRYEPAWIDLLCARGEVRYVLLESPARIVVAPGSSTEPFPPPSARVEGSVAEAIREVLRGHGALFVGDIVALSKRPVADVGDALARMLSAGELTNDAFSAARSAALSVAARSSGRWALRSSVTGDVSVSALVDRVLARYGVFARELVEREELSPAWTSMRDELDRRESRGEVRRGEVVAGLGAVQFARTESIESLRAARTDVAHDAVLLSARDPSLVAECGGLSRAQGVRVVLRDGEALAVIERDGAQIRTLRDLTERDAFSVGEALRSLARLPAGMRPFRTLAVERVDEGPATRAGVLADVLSSLGFERDGARLSLASYRA
jgi:ATP-dependent Lhr-like helicase